MKSCRNFSQQTTRSTPLDPNLMFRCISYYLGAFGTVCCVITLSSKQAKLVQKFVPRSCVGIFRSERTRSTHCTLNSFFGVFCTIWMHLDHLVSLQNSMQNRPNWCKSSCHGVASYVFASNTPDCPHWVLNSYFGVFRTIFVHLVPFGYHTKLGAKWAEVVQNFVP